MILSIHYLRGLAALFVVLFHYRGYINNIYSQQNLGDILFSKGSIGVDLFFIISGFIISLSTESNRKIKSFIMRRIFRIYPVYLFFIAAMVAIIPSIPLSDILKSMFFINLDYSGESPYFGYSVVFVGWTLTYEMVFYFLFMVSMIINENHRTWLCSAIVLTIFALCKIYINTINNNALGIIKILSSPMMIEFVMGMMSYEVYKVFKNLQPSELAKKLAIIISMLAFFVILNANWMQHGPWSFGMASLVIVISLLIIDSIFKYNKVMIFLGDISYSLYLCHAVTISFISVFNKDIKDVFNMSGFSFLLICVLVNIIIASMAHYLIEKPFIKLCRKISA